MRDTLRSLFVMGGLLASTQAFALPWNIDLVDSRTIKAYEREMRTLPEGVMSQPHLLTPVSYRRNFAWTDDFRLSHTLPEGFDAASPDTLASGAKMYNTYCLPCHGDGVQLGYVAEQGYPAVAVLAGKDGRLQNQTNGHVYLTIRNGSLSTLMPSYGYAMSETEMWDLIAWMRAELPNGKYVPPAPAPTEETQ